MNLIMYLPFPPSENSYYSHTSRGVYISAKGRRYREAVVESVREQNGVLRLDDRLAITVILHPTDRRVRDIDNYDKGLLDALTHAGVWVDDEQLDQLCFYRGERIAGGSCIVSITDAGPVIPAGSAEMVLDI